LGITVGFAQLIKSNLFLFPPLLMLWFVFAARGKPRWLVSLAALLVSFAVVQLITPLVNRLSPGGKAALLPSNAGHTLWYSNNPLADGYFTCAEALPAGQAFIERHGYTQRLKGADLFEEDRLYRTLALLWIRENPGRFLVLGLKKLNNAFGLFPRAVVFEGKPTARAVHLLTYGLLAPLMLAGLAVTFRRWRDLLLLYAVLFSFVVMVVLFYGTPRFTIVIIPFLLLFASSALWMCRDRLTSAK
jgi:uncharacterized membrane protein YhaH (DUF805 family)